MNILVTGTDGIPVTGSLPVTGKQKRPVTGKPFCSSARPRRQGARGAEQSRELATGRGEDFLVTGAVKINRSRRDNIQLVEGERTQELDRSVICLRICCAFDCPIGAFAWIPLTLDGSPWSSLCVSLRASMPEGAPGGLAQLGRVFFLFSSIYFFCKFWNIKWNKKCSDSKILFWKTVQIKTCSIQNLFNFEFHVQIQKICSNSNLFKFKFVQTRICSNSNLFKLDFV
jgi:hypothetical protein